MVLVSRNCWQFAVLAYATAKLGAILVPVNFMLREPEIAYIIDHAEPAVVIAQDALVPLLAGALGPSRHRRPPDSRLLRRRRRPVRRPTSRTSPTGPAMPATTSRTPTSATTIRSG